MDDIFAAFDNDCTCEHFLNVLNTQYPHLKYAIEKATEPSIFLDIIIKIFDNDFKHSVHRKQSNTGFLLNYNANCSKIWNVPVTQSEVDLFECNGI